MSQRNIKPTINAARKPCCKVCKDAGKTELEYGNHWPKDSNGKTVCPTLLAQECRYCGKSGHTVKYCQVLTKENSAKEKFAKQEDRKKRAQAHEAASKPNSVAASTSGRFAMLMDDDSDESPRRAEKKAPAKEEFPALNSSWSKRPTATPVANVSFAEMANKSEKQTRDEERLGKAIAEGMVVIERGSQGIKMTVAPKTEQQLAREKYNYDCFKCRNGLTWADADDSSDDEDEDEQYESNDAW
jgi:hypothetical protein